jgi:hypothetical protein
MSTINTVDLSELDLRYENCRMKQPKKEERLLLSILKKGIREPLRGVESNGTPCLLDGFKRLRSAKKLGIAVVPYQSLGNDEATGIIELMRESLSQGLPVIEQVKLVEALKSDHGWSVRDSADYLGKSSAWVSIRVTMNRQLPEKAAGHILAGRFPPRAYLYTILPFTRVNRIKTEQVEQFIDLMAGQDLSTREIDQLAKTYFQGKPEIKKQIEKGNLKWVLECLNQKPRPANPDSDPLEQNILHNLHRVFTGISTLLQQSRSKIPKSGSFLAQANLMVQEIENTITPFLTTIRRFNDRSE